MLIAKFLASLSMHNNKTIYTIPPMAAVAKVRNILVECGSKYSTDAMTAEAKTYFPILFQGTTILTEVRIIAYKTKNMAILAAILIAVT
jgi:hypothetical protein